MKKRLFALMLVLAMVLGMNTVVFAAEGEPEFYKVYANDKFVEETLQFEITQDQTAGAPELVVENYEVKAANNTIPFSATVKENTKVGEYTYTVKEKDVKTQGVTYGTEVITVKVLVVADPSAQYGVKVGTIGVAKPADADKNDTITNTYQTGTLTVTKNIKGNMIKADDKFSIVVTFTKTPKYNVIGDVTWKIGETAQETITDELLNAGTVTKTFDLVGGQSATFENIPYGVTYTVKEADATAANYSVAYSGTDVTNTTAEYDIDPSEDVIEVVANARANALEDGEMNTASENVTITNYKNQSVDTGIIVNNMPYIVALVVLVAAAVVFFRRRREF